MSSRKQWFSCPSCGRTRETQVRGGVCFSCYDRQRPRQRKTMARCSNCGRTRLAFHRQGLCSACYEQGRRRLCQCKECGKEIETPFSYAQMQICPNCYYRSRIVQFECSNCQRQVTGRPTAGLCNSCVRQKTKIRLATCSLCGQTRLTEFTSDNRCKACRSESTRRAEGIKVASSLSAEEYEVQNLAKLAPLRRAWVREFLDTACQQHSANTRRRFMRTVVQLDQYLESQPDIAGGQWSMLTPHHLESYLAEHNRHSLQYVKTFFSWLHSRKRVPSLVTILPDFKRTLRLQVLPLEQILELYQHWTSETSPPAQALIGLLALVHCLTSQQIRYLRLKDIVGTNRLLIDGKELLLAEPVATALTRYLEWRAQTYGGPSSYVLVSQLSRLHDRPVSSTWFHKDLLPGTPIASLRQSAIQQLVRDLGCDGLQLAAYTRLSLQSVQTYLKVFAPLPTLLPLPSTTSSVILEKEKEE